MHRQYKGADQADNEEGASLHLYQGPSSTREGKECMFLCVSIKCVIRNAKLLPVCGVKGVCQQLGFHPNNLLTAFHEDLDEA